MAAAHAGDIDLLITDVVMPEMNGRELSEHLHAQYPELETLYMSGYTANVIAHRGVLEEGVSFIPKPLSIKDLGVKVRQVLDIKKHK
jgi:two-component system, cell cycle sensor histidine kinase and response regulator CckA